MIFNRAGFPPATAAALLLAFSLPAAAGRIPGP